MSATKATGVKKQALDLATYLNDGVEVIAAANLAGLDPEELFGESMLDADDALGIEDPDNGVIDVGWEDEVTHYQLRRWWHPEAGVKVWEAFERRTLTSGGKEIEA